MEDIDPLCGITVKHDAPSVTDFEGRRYRFCSIAALFFVPVAALAQAGPAIDPQSASPPLRYESAINAYRPRDDKVQPAKEWRSANDLVRDTGSMSGMSMGDESGDMKDMGHGEMNHGNHGAGIRHEEGTP